MTSVPVNRNDALNFVDSISPYLEWQSDPAYKADPPADYAYAAYDLVANLASIRTKISNNGYKSEYDFQADLLENVFLKGHDGHMVLYPDLLARATSFGRRSGLVSISSDGAALPQIKFKNDVAAQGNDALVVAKINGSPATEFILNEVRQAVGSQDIDAAYNQHFYQVATSIQGSKVGQHASGGRGRFLYHGQYTNYTMSDGSVRSEENVANIIGDFTGVTDGPSFYKKFCTPQKPAADPAATSVLVNGRIPGYPEPIVTSRDGIISGYYLEGQGNEDTAVLTMLSFHPNDNNEWQDVTSQFFAQARQDGKTKLILDVQANGGGFIFLGYDLFRQLFPQTREDGNSRWKANKAFLGVSQAYSKSGTKQNYFSWHSDLNINDTHFTSFDDKFSGTPHRNTPYTDLMRWDFASNTDPFTVTGYGDRTDYQQPFRAEDIVLLYDGYCASTCTIASELLRIRAGVKSVAFGGRPTQDAIQGVGGIKGSQVLDFSSIYQYIRNAYSATKDIATRKEFDRYTTTSWYRASHAGVNVRDTILRDNIDDGTPSQYVYEAADCRKYWTNDMVNDVANVWKAAADAAFHGGSCVSGGIQRRGEEARSAALSFVPKVTKTIDAATKFIKGDYSPKQFSQEFKDQWLQLTSQ